MIKDLDPEDLAGIGEAPRQSVIVPAWRGVAGGVIVPHDHRGCDKVNGRREHLARVNETRREGSDRHDAGTDHAVFRDLHTRGLAKMVEVEKTGCEGLAKWLYDYIDLIWMPDNGYADRCRIVKVEVRETPSNSASFVRPGYV